MITQKYVKSILNYDKETGIFTWKVAKGSRGKIGNIAGNVKKDSGRIVIVIDKKNYKAHRLAWLYEYGYMPKEHIDHKNHNTLDNSIKNLRLVTHQVNMKNRSIPKHNTSGVMGVCWSEKRNRWYAQIALDRKNKFLGYFTDFSDAVNARKNAEVLYGYYKNHGAENV